MITERIEKRKREKDELQGQLAIEMGKQVTFITPQIKAFLYSLKRGNITDENNRRGMVNIFLRAIYLYDNRMTLIFNGGDRPITIDDILLDEIEEHFESAVSGFAGCSPLVAVAPPTCIDKKDAGKIQHFGEGFLHIKSKNYVVIGISQQPARYRAG